MNYNGPRSGTAGFQSIVPADVWWLTQTKVLLMYLKLAFWPWPLSIHYDISYLTWLGAAWPWLLCAALLIIGTLILLWRRNAAGFVGAWMLLILSPTLIVPIITEAAAERRMYLPLAALVTLVVVGGYWLSEQIAQRFAANMSRTSANRRPIAVVAAIALPLAVVLSLVSVRRLAAYEDELTLWQDVLEHHPDDAIAHNNLGIQLEHSGRPEEALENYRQSLRLNPNHAEAHNNLGTMLAHAGQTQEAIEHFQQALRLRPNYPQARYNLGLVLYKSGHPQEAIEHLERSLRLKPKYAECQYYLGLALIDTGRKQESIEHFQQALRRAPNNANIHNSLGSALLATGRPAEAIEHFQQARKHQSRLRRSLQQPGLGFGHRFDGELARSTAGSRTGQKSRRT